MRSAVLLAGGRSTRIGVEKALVDFRGKPLVQWVLDVLSRVGDEVVASVSTTPSEGLVHALGRSVIIVPDRRPGMGPVEGLISAFGVVRGEYVAVAPTDAPFLQRELFEVLFSRAEGLAGAVPVVNGYYEPLIAVYHRDLYLKALETVSDRGRTKPVDAYPLLDLAFVEDQELLDAGISMDAFVNINLPEEMERYNVD
jgi:molybdopterin-guanine dinucleotide biosynthesis protein A